MIQLTRGSDRSGNSHRKWWRKLLAGAAVAWGFGTPAFAQYTWTGGGTTPFNWTDSSNWGGTAPVSSSTTTLTFAGSVGLANTNNYASPFQLSTMTFSSGAGAFNITGTSALQFATGGGIANNSTSVQTINVPIQTTGPFSLSGTGSFSIPNAISGTGSLTIAMSGTAAVTMSVPASYVGATSLQTGTLILAGNNVLPVTSPLIIGSTAGSTGMIFNMGGFSQTVSGLTIYAPSATGNTVVTNGARLTVNGNISLVNNTSNPGNAYGVTISGSILDLNGGIRTITVAGQNHGPSPGDLVLDLVVANGGFIFTGNPSPASIVSANAPTGLTLGATSANTYALGTTVNAGTLNVASTTTLGTGGLTIAQSGSILSAVVLNSSMTLTSLATGTIASSTFTKLTLGPSSSTLDVTQSTNTTFAGIISGAGGFTKSGTGTLTLTGPNTYTGVTTVSAGNLSIGTGGSLAAGSIVNVNSTSTLSGTGTVNGTLTIASGGTLSGGISGVGTLTLNGPVTISSGATLGITISNGSTPSSTPGGSTIGTIPNTTSNNFISITGSSVSINTNALITVNGTGTSFTLNQPYSYEIAKASGLNLSTLDIATQSQFSAVGFSANTFSLTGDASGDVYLNFTATTPEPGAVLSIGAACAGLLGFVRRRRNRGRTLSDGGQI